MCVAWTFQKNVSTSKRRHHDDRRPNSDNNNENTLGSIAQTKGVSIYGSIELKLDRIHFRNKTVRVVAQVRSDNVEHGVTEAADVQDVAPFRSLRRTVRLDDSGLLN